MNKHTPGPWVVLERYADRNAIPVAVSIGNGAHAIFCECNGLGGVSGQTEGDYNARLIASAFELLEALERLCVVVGAYDNGQMLPTAIVDAASDARSAIAKARGL